MPEEPEKKQDLPTRCRGYMKACGVWLCGAWAATRKRLVPAEGLGKADMALLRWVVLCAAVLIPVGILMATDAFYGVDEWQVEFLLGHPFYLDAQDVQVSLLGHGGVFGICTLLTLYLSLVLLAEKRIGRRTQICILALVAVALPGMLCVLWHGVLYMAPPMLCVALLWLLTFIPFFHPEGKAS